MVDETRLIVVLLALALAYVCWIIVSKLYFAEGFRSLPPSRTVSIENPATGGLGTSKTIALVIPCIPKHVDQVKKLVSSIKEQTRIPDEIIVALSATSDKDGRDLQEELRLTGLPVIVSSTPHKSFAGKNRNRGASVSKSDLISFMDADDRMHPQRTEALCQVQAKTSSNSIVHTYVMKENGDDLPGNVKKFKVYESQVFHDKNKTDKEPHFEKWPFEMPIHHGHVTITRALFGKVKQPENMKRGQDAAFLRRIMTAYPDSPRVMVGIDFPLSKYQPRFSTRAPEPLNVRYVVSACNETNEYENAIPMFISSWRSMYPAVTIKILLIRDTIPTSLAKYSPYLVLIKPIKGLSTVFMAQYSRILYPPLLPGENGIQSGGVVISDIDLLPANKAYFSDNAFDGLKTDTFVNMRGDSDVPNDQIAIAYSVATPLLWQKINGIHNMQELTDRLIGVNKRVKYKNGREIGWESDQKDLYRMVQDWRTKGGQYKELTGAETGFNRLGRRDLNDDEASLQTGDLPQKIKENIEQGVYSDYHMLHPVGKYKRLDQVVANIIS